MSDWRTVLFELGENVDHIFDTLKTRLMYRLYDRPIMIVPYLGYGTRTRLELTGRVLVDQAITSAKDNDTIWQNLVNTYKRYETDEIPYAQVRASFGTQTVEVTSDEEGYFHVVFELESPLGREPFLQEIQLELIDYANRIKPLPEVKATGQVLVPPSDAQFGVISDLDDTVIRTDVLSIIKLARNTFLHNSRTRLPFEGVAAFYSALQKGTTQTFNPIFYVSSSPWNLYDLIIDFFSVRGIPIGPLFLRDLGLSPGMLRGEGHREHKLEIILHLLKLYPDLPFILIGDSTQHDPEIYAEAARMLPERIKAIYIRDVHPATSRDESVLRIADSLKPLGVDMLLVPDTVGAAEDAVLKRLIPEDAMMDIRVERTEDQKEPEKLEKLLDPQATPDELYDEPEPPKPA